MRRLVRPLVMLALLCGVTTAVHSQQGGGGGVGVGTGLNLFYYNAGSPCATITPGGVSVSVTDQPLPGWNVNYIQFILIDSVTLQQVVNTTVNNPPATVNETFWDLQSHYTYNLSITAVFQNGAQFQSFLLTGSVTTN